MAGKTKRMGQVKQLLMMHQKGFGKKAISRALGVSKNTVKGYLNRYLAMNVNIEDLVKLDEFSLEKMFFSGSPSYKDPRYDDLKDRLESFVKELKRTGVTRNLLWEEYKENLTHYYSYSQFCYHLHQHQQSSKPSMVLNHNPAEKMFIDFTGDKLSYVDIQTGEVIYCEVFVACFPYSDYGFAIAVKSQRIEDFIYAVKSSLLFFGGVPQVIVPDNLKSAVIKTHRYEPSINRALEDLANHYGTVISPARAYKPKDKALVENHVKLIYSRVFAKLRNRIFFSLAELNEAIVVLVKNHNQTRMQNKDYCREEKYLAEEKNLLKALPTTDFEIKYYKELKVAKNGHIMLFEDKHYYSVPHQYIGQKVKVVYTRSLVCVYCNSDQIAVHERIYAKGKYSFKKEHLCSHHRHYLELSPDYYKVQAAKLSPKLEELIKLIFTDVECPETLYRRCNGLINLGRKTNKEKMDAACQIAINTKVYTYHFIENILKNNVTQERAQANYKPLPLHENTRGKEYYC